MSPDANPETAPAPKARHPYAVTGGIMLLVVLGAIVAAFTAPYATVHVSENFETARIEYHLLEIQVHSEEETQTIAYRDASLDDGENIGMARSLAWLVPAAGLLVLTAAILMLAAPSSTAGFGLARAGSVVGLVGIAGLLVAVVMGLTFYADHAAALKENLWDDASITSNGIAQATYYLGAAMVLGAGGSMLGFSDRPAASTPGHARVPAAPKHTAPVTPSSAPLRPCTACHAPVGAARFCPECGMPQPSS